MTELAHLSDAELLRHAKAEPKSAVEVAQHLAKRLRASLKATAQAYAPDTRGDEGIDHLSALRDARLRGAAPAEGEPS
jgi:hypothetical protein